MPARKNNLKEQLSRLREINITVIGRKSGRAIRNPVWFVLEGEKLYLLPVSGSDTQWYKNVLKNSSIQIETSGAETTLNVAPITDAKQVASVTERFRKKYGARDLKKYYSKLDVAIVAPMQ